MTETETLKKKLEIAIAGINESYDLLISPKANKMNVGALLRKALTDIGMLDREASHNNSELRQRLDAQGADDLANDLLGTLDRKDGEE